MKVDDSAKAYLKLSLDARCWMRITINAGGCNGFEKIFAQTDHTCQGDHIFEGVVVVDNHSLDLLGECTLSYVSNIEGAALELMVKGAVSQCGCGRSFDI
jgi:iron-sulfur cluster assembly protein